MSIACMYVPNWYITVFGDPQLIKDLQDMLMVLELMVFCGFDGPKNGGCIRWL